MSSRAVRVIHLITDLRVGGAEIQLARLAESMRARPSTEVTLVGVACLGRGGATADRIEQSGVRVWRLGAAGPIGFLRAAWRLSRLLRSQHVDVVVAWLYHSMIAVSLPGIVPDTCRRAWNVRGTLPGPRDRLGTRIAVHASRLLSSKADAIVYNSETARQEHEALGFAAGHAEVIPNGYALGASARGGHPVDARTPAEAVILLGARFHPMKDFGTFLAALSILRSGGRAVRGRLMGEGCVADNQELRALLRATDTENFVDAIGAVSDVDTQYGRADVVCSSSAWGEGFQNVIAEAALRGVPVVSTDVGEARVIVGDPRFLVPPGEPSRLADAIGCMLDLPAAERSALVRETQERLGRQFGEPAMRQRYEELATRLASARFAHNLQR